MRVEEWRADEAGAEQRVYDVAHGAIVREADPLSRLHENAATAAGIQQRGHLGRRGHGGTIRVRWRRLTWPRVSSSERGLDSGRIPLRPWRTRNAPAPERKTHARPRQRSGRSGSVQIYQRGVKGATVPGVPGFSGASIGRSRLGRPM